MDATHAAEGAPAPEAQPQTCFRHPDRESYVRCTRCDRNVCPDCRKDAAVGYQCVECVKSGHQSVRQARTAFGGRISATPWATIVLIALNVIAYLLELARPEIVDHFDVLGTALLGPDGQHYVNNLPYTPSGFTAIGVAHGEWYRLITGTFLHLQPTSGLFGITHILFNMYWLWILGRVVEERLGVLRFSALYLLSGLGGSVFAYLVAPTQPSLGASGAIFGLAGGYFVLSRRMHYDPLGGSQLMVTFVIWMVISAGFTSWEGHLGGLVTGLTTGYALAYAPRQQRNAVQLVGVVLVFAFLAALAVLKTTALNSP
ncbi:rhomboid family intramembrane serine protease [Kitasatospora sp. NPDC049285]|uniref:rhomboid family intramembrane serine protease n=1 Tax=Kitasatospora sp. NPDC049285 TaxID=3157096 RepID=UPI003422189B